MPMTMRLLQLSFPIFLLLVFESPNINNQTVLHAQGSGCDQSNLDIDGIEQVRQ